MQAFLPSALPLGLTKEKAVSLTASVVVNLAMIVAFASIADIGVQDIKEGASLVVVGLGAAEAEASAAEAAQASSPPAPPPVSESVPPAPSPEFAPQHEKPLEPRIALLQRPEPVPQRTDAVPTPAEAKTAPSPDQLREAAEQQQQRQAQEAAKARAADQAQAQAKAAASDRPAAQSGARAGGSGGYKAVIWQHLQRFRRPNAVGAGSTLVRFSIDGNGAALNVGVARSSGSATFDREALQMVRRAAPFPKPPQGVGTDFVFAIEGQ